MGSTTRLAAVNERIPPGGEELAAYQLAIEHAKDEIDEWRKTSAETLRKYLQAKERIDQLESQLGSTHELLSILRDASLPAAAALFNVAQIPGIDERIKETIGQTLAPLDAALAATKGDDQ